MIFSLTPDFLRSIMRSVERSNLVGLDPIIAMIVFSLKSALTNLITEVFVSRSCVAFCAVARFSLRLRQKKIRRSPKIKDFMVLPRNAEYRMQNTECRIQNAD